MNDQTIASKKKVSLLRIAMTIFGIGLFIFVGYVIGVSRLSYETSVLGSQTSEPIASRLAVLMNLEIERPSQLNNTIEKAPIIITLPTRAPTAEPTPTTDPADDRPDLMWAGTNRNPKSTVTPTPNNVITVPEPTEIPGAPTPTTPQYEANWGRKNNNPTPTPNNVIIEATVSGKKPVDKTRTVPSEIQNMIDGASMQIGDLQIIKKENQNGLNVSGLVREKLLGFLSVGYPVSFKVDQDMGTVESISIPWWRSLFGNPFVGTMSKIRCGDGICSSTESITSCQMDCEKVCGNGICEFGEGTDTCSQDCEIIN